MLRKKLVKGLLIVSLCVTGLFLISGLLIYFNKDALKQHLVDALNRELATELNTKSIQISFWKNFPSVSVVFEEVRLKNPNTFRNSDSSYAPELARAASLSFSFNLFSVFRGNYTLNKVIVEEGTVTLCQNREGISNWNILKESKGEVALFSVKLPDIRISETKVEFRNYNNNLSALTYIHHSDWKAGFSNELSTITGMIKADLIRYNYADIQWRNINNISLFGAISLNKKGWEINLNKLQAGTLNISVEGTISGHTGGHSASLVFHADNLNYETIKPYLKPEWTKKLNPYQGAGNIQSTSRLSWKQERSFSWQYSGDFTSNEIRFTIPDSKDLQLESSVKGSFRLGNMAAQPDYLKLEEFAIHSQEYPFKGRLHWAGPDWNLIDLVTEGSLPLSLLTALTDSTIAETSGKINVLLHGVIDLRNEPLQMLNDLSGNFEIHNAAAIVNTHQISNLYSKGALSKGDFLVRDLKLDHPNLHSIRFKGSILLPKGEVNAIGIRGDIDISKAAFKNLNESGNSAGFAIPPSWQILTAIRIASFEYENFQASEISGNLLCANGSIQLNDIRFNSCGGNIQGTIDWNQESNGTNLRIDANAEEIDLKKLFKSFNNFAQNNITADNISGQLSAHVQINCPFNKQAKCIPSGIIMTGDYSIESGRLKEVKSFYSLSEYIELDELKDIVFETMQGEIMIRNSRIVFPETNIMNSALNIRLSGEHAFDGTIDYNFRLYLSRILAGKFRKRNKENDAFGNYLREEKEERLEIAVRMYGTTDKPLFEIKKGTASSMIKSELKKERETIKQLWKNRKSEDIPNKENVSFEESLSYFSESTPTSKENKKDRESTRVKDKESEETKTKKNKKIHSKKEESQEFSGNSDDFN